MLTVIADLYDIILTMLKHGRMSKSGVYYLHCEILSEFLYSTHSASNLYYVPVDQDTTPSLYHQIERSNNFHAF